MKSKAKPEAPDVRPDDMLPDVVAVSDPNATRIVVILDRSGSMQSCCESTVAGFNDFVREQKKQSGTATLKLVQFDDQYEVVFDESIQNVPELTQATFVPRGSTALLDAQGKTIAILQEELAKLSSSKRPAKVIVVTMTDGMENASKEYKKQQVADLIQKYTDQNKWQFIYIGANQDAVKVAESMNIPLRNTMSYNTSNARGVMGMSVSNLVSSYRSAGLDDLTSSTMGFSAEDRKSALEDNTFSSTIASVANTPSSVNTPVTVPPDKDDA